MKYNIEGIETGEIITSYGKSEKEVLEVRYKDNTSDYFPARKEFSERINTVMEEQANTYVSSGRDKKLETRHVLYTVSSVLSGVGALVTVPYIATGVASSEPAVAATGAAVVCTSALVVSLIKRGSAKKELDYIKKLRLYLENKGLISERYSTIKETEANLGMDEGFKSLNINNVDRISLDDMEEAISKCKRYPKIDNTTFKKHL